MVGHSTPCSCGLSAFSLPVIPSWAGHYRNATGQSISARMRRACKAEIRPGPISEVCIRFIAACALAKIVVFGTRRCCRRSRATRCALTIAAHSASYLLIVPQMRFMSFPFTDTVSPNDCIPSIAAAWSSKGPQKRIPRHLPLSTTNHLD